MTAKSTWTRKEVKYLKDNWRSSTGKEIATALGKNPQACFDKAHKLGLRKRNGYGTPIKRTKAEISRQNVKAPKWTTSEVTFLKNNMNKISNKEISKVLGKSVAAVSCKKQSLKKVKNLHPAPDPVKEVKQNNKFKAWTKDEEQILKRDFNKVLLKELAERLGRTEDALKTRAYTLGLINNGEVNPRTKWEKEDVNYLKKSIKSKSYEEIGEYLGRSSAAVASKASSLKISKSPIRKAKKSVSFNTILIASSVALNIGLISFIILQLLK